MGGHKLAELSKIRSMFEQFWLRYKEVDDTNIPQDPAQTIPIYLHGDEGRGQGKKPILVVGFQPLLHWSDEEDVKKYLDWTIVERFLVFFVCLDPGVCLCLVGS